MNRLDRLRARLDRGMMLMEIGPSHRPIAPKADGWMTTVVDHASRADLAAKYADHDVDLSQLEEVDVVWDGGDLAAQAPSERRANYDAIIASHVLEHIPDPISFLISAHALLKPGGMILLALPDKRFCFDFFAPLTSTGDWLSAYEIKARTHNKRTSFNHVAYAVRNNGQIGWAGPARGQDLSLINTLPTALHHFKVATDTGAGAYTDYHAWRMTPSSFCLLVLESAALLDLDLHVADCSDTIAHEFHVVLRSGGPALDAEALEHKRRALLLAMVRELAAPAAGLDVPEIAPAPPPEPRAAGRRAWWRRLGF
jgi:SAM-dependent methyltransferase